CGDATNGGSGTGELRDASGVRAFAAALLDVTFGGVDLLIGAAAIDRAQMRREFDYLSTGQCQGVDANGELGFTLDSSGTHGTGHHSLHVASFWDHNLVVRRDGNRGLEVDEVALAGGTSADGILQPQQRVAAL